MPMHFAMRFATLSTLIFCVSLSAEDSTWPQWRGPEQNGVAPAGDYPLEWSTSQNVLWKYDFEGLGGSTPVVAGRHAFFTAGDGGKNTLVAVNLDTGEKAWSVSLGDDKGNKHRKGSGSNPSAVTDGKHVFAYFRSGDLAAVDLEGNVAWQVNLQDEFGEDTLWWDLGSSPMLIDDLVVVAVMQSGPSYVVAYDRATGKRAWKADRVLGAPEEAAQSYATPLAIKGGNIAVMGADNLTIHSAKTGKQLGRVPGFNPEGEKYFRSISSPVISGDYIVCPYSRGATITVCRIDDVIEGKGRDSIAWHRDGLGSDVPTPAIKDGRVYVVGDSRKLKSNGVVSAVDLKTGKDVWTMTLPKSRQGFSSSPLVAGNHLYVTAEDATTYVIGPLDAEEPDVVATNTLDDSEPFTVASLIPHGGGFLLRTRHSLYRIGG
ncbi:MAG: PQQ-binding-like beta-propeller repeat protein [Planctomycetota bacterium]